MAPVPKEEQLDVGIFHPKVIFLSLGVSLSGVVAYKFYIRYLKRVRNSLEITPTILNNQQKMYGKVTRVGDGDNFRFYHTPGGSLAGWGWARSVPTTRGALKDETLMIRLCGVDAPERAHWGKPAQPFSEEALEWLKAFIGGRYVTITPFSIDQYKRVVARAQVWKWTGKKDVSAEMIREGIGLVYESKTGAEFGDSEDYYRFLEAKAKRQRKGLWSLGSQLTTPGEYKKKHYNP